MEEGLAFNYWLVILQLLKLGLPYDAILSFTEDELSVVLGVQLALEQRDSEEQAKAERLAEQRTRARI